MERIAHCACGWLRATCAGEPVRSSVCHCLECQRRTGSAFGSNATYAGDQVRIEGESTAFRLRPSAEAAMARRRSSLGERTCNESRCFTELKAYSLAEIAGNGASVWF